MSGVLAWALAGADLLALAIAIDPGGLARWLDQAAEPTHQQAIADDVALLSADAVMVLGLTA